MTGTNGPVAAVDCGTNSLRLLVARRSADGRPVDLERRVELVRLGQGVDATAAFHPDALERTAHTCRRYAEVIADHGCRAVRFVATSAARDVRDPSPLVEVVRESLGVVPEVLTGDQEAALSFAGAASAHRDGPDPTVVVDCGGGSTELVVGQRTDLQVDRSTSLDVGSVRLRERVLHDDPPTPRQVEQARRLVAGMLDSAPVDLATTASAIGVAGTFTTLAAIDLGLREYRRELVDGHVLTTGRVRELTERLLAATVSETMAMGPLRPRRAEVISAGALIVCQVMDRLGCGQLSVSEADILDGVAATMLGDDTGDDPADGH